MGLQSWERKGPFYFLTKNIILGKEKAFNMTNVVILVLQLITFIIGRMKLLILVLANLWSAQTKNNQWADHKKPTYLPIPRASCVQ